MTTPAPVQHLFDWVLWNSAGAAVLVALVFAAHRLFGSRMPARWRHNLWMIVVLRLLIPTLPTIQLPATMRTRFDRVHHLWAHAPESPSKPRMKWVLPQTPRFSDLPNRSVSEPFKNEESSPKGTPQYAARTAPNSRLRLAWAAASPAAPDSPPAAVTPPNSTSNHSIAIETQPTAMPIRPAHQPDAPGRRVTVPEIVTLVWLTVSLLLFGRVIFVSVRLALATRRLESLGDPCVQELLVRCCRELDIKIAPRLLVGPADSGPALVGAIVPRLLLPPCVLSRFSRSELRLVLLHELAHLRRRDIAVNYVLSLLQCVHWFNPLIWFAFKHLREERELACDEMVLSVTAGRESRAYGSTIVRLLELLSRGAAPWGAVGAIQHKALMHRRIAMIAHFDATRRIGWKGLIPMLAIGLVAAASLVRAEPPADAPAPASPNVALDPARPKEASSDAVTKARANIDGAADRPADARPPMDEPPPQPESPAPVPQTTVPQEKPSPNTAMVIRGIEDAASVRADEQTLQKLARTEPLKLDGVPLGDVLGELADAAKVDIVLDQRAISQEAGIDPSNASVTMSIREPRPTGDLLNLVLRLVNPQLDYAIVNGVVLVSTRGELARHLVTRVYRVDGLGNVAELSNAVAQVIRPESGRPELQFVGSKLIVTAPEPAQRQVRKLLDLLADQPEGRAEAGAMPKTSPTEPAITSVPNSATNLKLANILPQLVQLRAAYWAVVRRYGTNSQQERDLRTEIEALCAELDAEADQLVKAGRGPEAEKIRLLIRNAVPEIPKTEERQPRQ